MAINLTPEQEAWLSAYVASGGFASIEEAALGLLSERIAELDLERDDLAWAKPAVDDAMAEYEQGKFITLAEHEARNDARLAALKP